MNPGPKLVRQNVVYSVLDYVSQPVMMIAAAPILLKTLGAPQYGAWMLVNSIVATATGLGGGFGDGATKFISMYRGRGDREGVARSLVASLAVNFGLGLGLAVVLSSAAPVLMGKVFHLSPTLYAAALIAIRISAVVLLVRFLEVVLVSAVRAFEQYRPVVIVSVSSRALLVGGGVLLATKGFGLIAILWVTLATESLALIALTVITRRILGVHSLANIDLRAGVGELCGFGAFTWLKSAAGILFGYADRLLVAAVLGTASLAFYSLCNQVTQPIPAVLAAAFNFMFPNLSAQSATGSWAQCRESYRKAVLVSVILVIAVGLPLVLLAQNILALWLGPAVAVKCKDLLIAMTVGNGLLALAVVPHYTAMAFGRVRALAYINIAAGVGSLGGLYLALHYFGLVGAGVARVLAGLISLTTLAVVRGVFRKAAVCSPETEQPVLPTINLDAVGS